MLVKDKEVESFASTTAMVESLSKKYNLDNLNGKLIFEKAKNNEEIYVEAIDSLCENLAAVMTNCACLLNPQAIVLGGGIMEQKQYLKPIIEKHFKRKCHKPIYESTEIKFAKLKNNAGMVGAYQHFLELYS